MNGAGQGLLLQIATVSPAGKSGELGLSVEQHPLDSVTKLAEFGQILAEQASNGVNLTHIAELALVGNPGQAIKEKNLMPETLPEAVAQLQSVVDAQLGTDAEVPVDDQTLGQPSQLLAALNGDALPPGGEVLPGLAASDLIGSEQKLATSELGEEELAQNAGLQQTAAESSLQVDPTVDESLFPSAIAADLSDDGGLSELKGNNGRAFMASLEQPNGNQTPAGVVPTAVPQSLGLPGHAAVLQSADSLLENPGQQTKAGIAELTHGAGLQGYGFQNHGLANKTSTQPAAVDVESQENLMLQKGLETTKSAMDAQGVLNRLAMSGEIIESKAAPEVAQSEYAARMEFNLTPTQRSATFGYGQLEQNAPVSTGVQIPIGQKGWTDAVIERVYWLSGQRVNNAEIHLDPPELGPLQLQITSKGDQASIFFSSSHASVREALEQGLPRLREMLESNGLQLADVNVSDQSPQQQAQENAQQASSFEAQDSQADNEGTGEGEAVAVRVPQGLVDDYV